MDSYAQLERLVSSVTDAEGFDGGQQSQGHGRHLPSMQVAIPQGEATDHHVGVPDCLHLVHVVMADDGVKGGVQVVEHVHHLQTHKEAL